MTQGPLAGVVILDLSMFISGPFGSTLLSDLGARVIKVEPLTGDPVRGNGIGPQVSGENAQFISVNHGKESLSIDLKTSAGSAALRRLVKNADVVFDNFRPAVRKRLGIDFETLSEVNPRIISCSISGYGQDGGAAPAFDLIVQALSGVMSVTGSPETGPARVGFQIGDLAGGLYAAIGVLAALQNRARTGNGSEVDISLLDTQIALLADDVTHSFINAEDPVSWGSAHPYLVPYQSFETKDRPIVVAAVGQEAFWGGLCRAIGVEHIEKDSRFANNAARVQHRELLIPLLQEVFLREGQRYWLDILQLHDVPSAPVLSVGESLRLDVVARRQMVRSVRGYEKDVKVAGVPVKFIGVEVEAEAEPAPLLGSHSRKVLEELGGYSPEQISQMSRDGVICDNEDQMQRSSENDPK